MSVEIARPISYLKKMLGLDRSIAYTVLARCINIVGSAGMVLLIIHFLSPIEQGYYYSLLNLVSLQAIFELGFSFVIQQLAAHESVHLHFSADGSVTGDAAAHGRLASILQLTVRWYLRAAILLVVILLPLGWVFFSDGRHAADHIAWQGPWALAAIGCAGTFTLAPLYSFIDGCGQVRQVALMRFGEGCAMALMGWAAMIAHKGLYAPAMVILGSSSVGFVFVWRRRNLLRDLLRYSSGNDVVSWRREVWPFQWKIATSWTCAYFTAQAFIPILFVLRGPVEAGQMGMSLSITGYMSVLLLPWISTKATPFGQMIARGDYDGLDRLFFPAIRRSTVLLFFIATTCWLGVFVIQFVYPRLASRMVPPWAFALLLFAMMSVFVVQCLAIYLRSFKREPFINVYVTTAVLSLVLVLVTAKRWGTLGAAASYAFSAGLIGLVLAVLIFRKDRHRLASPKLPLLQTEPRS